MTDLSDIVPLLLRAREILTPMGTWTRGAAARAESGRALAAYVGDGDYRGRGAYTYSLAGALHQAAYDRGARAGAVHAAAGYLLALLDRPSLEAWNDSPGRERVDVVALLDRAADKARCGSGGHR